MDERAIGAVMRIVCVGGGPAGLYFAILMKKARPSADVVVLERNRPTDTFGFGVVFSDATLEGLAAADPESYAQIERSFAHWDDIDVHIGGRVVTSTGHGFCGLSRQTLLALLIERARALGVRLEFEREVGDVEAFAGADLIVAADGVNSAVRARYQDHFRPTIGLGRTRFVWLGTTFPFKAFTFYFRENEHGLFRVHAYRYEPGRSTFIVECTDAAWRKTGLGETDEDATVAYMERLFAAELQGHRLLKNRSHWRVFPTIRCERWSRGPLVLMGDAVHTAHFSIGSGTKLAMEDAICLARALERTGTVRQALEEYEAERKQDLASLGRAAEVSQAWFEDTERFMGLDPLTFSFSLLTRSLRVTHENLRLRDPALVAEVDRAFAARAAQAAREPAPSATPPPLFTPFRLRGLRLKNRVVVSPMCQYSATDGTVNDWHLVHLGSRAVGGAGLVLTEMTDVSADGRITPGCAGLYQDEHVPAWRRVVDFVHAHSEAKIGVQLAHAGRKGACARPWEGDRPLGSGGWPLLGPSAVPYLADGPAPRQMDRADMDRVRADFVRATERALQAGFDLVELHMAHGYLLSSFLSPLSNLRSDEYGGGLTNRMRFPLEVLAAVRAAWPAERPLAVRISAADWAPGGLSPEESVALAQALALGGADVIDVSTGGTYAQAQPKYGRLYQTPFAERIRLEANVPVMTVGAISSYSDVNSILAAGRADLCVLARAHLFDPYWTLHAAQELGYPERWPKQYRAVERYTPRFK